MIGVSYIVTRLGLSLGGMLIPALLFGGLSLGGAGAWLFGWTDYKTAIVAVVAVAAGALLIITDSKLVRAAAIAVLVACVYVKGRIDEGLETQDKLDRQAAAIHKTYKDASDAELARQAAVAEEARKAAEVEKLKWQDERQKLRDELKRLNKEALNDPDADRDAFSVDAIDRLNRLLHERRPSAPNNLNLEAPARGSPRVDDPPVPTPEAPRPN